MADSNARGQTASRLGAVLIVLAIVMLIALLPRRYQLVPTPYAYAAAAAICCR